MAIFTHGAKEGVIVRLVNREWALSGTHVFGEERSQRFGDFLQPQNLRLGNFTRVVEEGFVCSGLLIIVFVRRFDSELASRGGCIGWGRALLLLLQDLILPRGLASGIAVWVIWISAPFSFLARGK